MRNSFYNAWKERQQIANPVVTRDPMLDLHLRLLAACDNDWNDEAFKAARAWIFSTDDRTEQMVRYGVKIAEIEQAKAALEVLDFGEDKAADEQAEPFEWVTPEGVFILP